MINPVTSTRGILGASFLLSFENHSQSINNNNNDDDDDDDDIHASCLCSKQ